MQRTITSAPFGRTPAGAPVSLFTLTNAQGVTVNISDFGGIVSAIEVPDRDGKFANICLGFDTFDPYLEQSPYFGALIGRYGNRIAGAAFTLDGERHALPANDGLNHLHGGPLGFHRVLWQAQVDGGTLELRYRSADGEQGYPGALDVQARYTLTDDNELILRLHAQTDKATPVNLTHHAYFNLAGGGDVLGHRLAIDADDIAPVGAGLIPTGALLPVAGTAFDFRVPRPIGERIGCSDEQLRHGAGYDHHFILNKRTPHALALAARVHEPVSGRVLELLTDQPGVQFYSGNFLDGTLSSQGWRFIHRGGFCLEPQHCPDSPNQPHFPSTILRPGQQYRTEMRFRFTVQA